MNGALHRHGKNKRSDPATNIVLDEIEGRDKMTQRSLNLLENKIKEYRDSDSRDPDQGFYLQGLIHGLMLAEDLLTPDKMRVYDELADELKEVMGV